ncbi:GntR family transcriptional regulator [Selenomonas sp. TAMA-11512]|uniref:GntR family transcriptional regulator n=1 Tax=Selenomonas sp. TAMA-11512 TaxID=3095337 RepID=UPI00308DD7E3|nr:GntR family transcriptional regulator [Selenomonas sp. TAMA-11512]
MEIDRTSSKPLYMQLEEIFRQYIANGDWEAGKVIPSENELCREYGLSRMTVRTVIKTLADEGLLYRVQGKGTFVSEEKIIAHSPSYAGFREQLEAQGYITQTETVAFKVIQASKKIAKALEVPEDSEVRFIVRVRMANNKPVSIHESYIPYSLCKGLREGALANEQLCHIMENDFGCKQKYVNETFESVLATEKEAKLLGISKGYPLILMEEITRDEDKKVFEYTKIIFRGDVIKLSFNYEM